jgi:hypothetical protein
MRWLKDFFGFGAARRLQEEKDEWFSRLHPFAEVPCSACGWTKLSVRLEEGVYGPGNLYLKWSCRRCGCTWRTHQKFVHVFPEDQEKEAR